MNTMDHTRDFDADCKNDHSKQACEASVSSSFEVYAAIGGDPDVDQVDDLFIAASKSVLNIENRTRRRNRRGSVTGSSISETKIQLTTEVDVIDCDKLGIYFSSEDGIRCFSIVVNILVTSSNGDLCRISTTAENLAFAAELAFTNGEFEDKLKELEVDVSVLLTEMVSESSSSDNDEDVDEDDDDDDDSSSIGSGEFNDFLEISYREYLQDQNRQEILSRIQPPISPSTVSAFPSDCPSTSPYTIDLQNGEMKSKSVKKVKFDPVVRVKNTLSRHDMNPNETYDYWNGEEEFMTIEERDRILRMLTDKWTYQQSKKEAENEPDLSSPTLLVPVLPATECEGHDGYTYTISIRD